MIRYFRQALAMIREERLYSAMYSAGTALAVASHHEEFRTLFQTMKTPECVTGAMINVRDVQTARQVQKETVERLGVGRQMRRTPAVHLWFDDFGTHFLVVSAVVYLIILCIVLIGTAIPAWRICRSTITEAIKEE